MHPQNRSARVVLRVVAALLCFSVIVAYAVFAHRQANPRRTAAGTKSTQVLEDLRQIDAATETPQAMFSSSKAPILVPLPAGGTAGRDEDVHFPLVNPYQNSDRTVSVPLDLAPQVVEFEGFINYGSPISTNSPTKLDKDQVMAVSSKVMVNIFNTKTVEKVLGGNQSGPVTPAPAAVSPKAVSPRPEPKRAIIAPGSKSIDALLFGVPGVPTAAPGQPAVVPDKAPAPPKSAAQPLAPPKKPLTIAPSSKLILLAPARIIDADGKPIVNSEVEKVDEIPLPEVIPPTSPKPVPSVAPAKPAPTVSPAPITIGKPTMIAPSSKLFGPVIPPQIFLQETPLTPFVVPPTTVVPRPTTPPGQIK